MNVIGTMMRLLGNKYLLGQLVKRDVLLRYRGAYFGLLWIFFSPLVMLGIYSFVFGQIFQSRWPQQMGNIPFALNLYCGLIVFNILSETLARSTDSVRGYPSYVKKIIFPVEILPIVPLGAALFHGFFNFMILVGALAWTSNLHMTVLLFPFLLLPLIFGALGLAWFFSAWGVFIKDLSQVLPMFLQMLMFLSPIFYPVQAVPEGLQPLYKLNPLSTIIEAERAAISGSAIDWNGWALTLIVGLLVFILGNVFFNHSRDEFADVL